MTSSSSPVSQAAQVPILGAFDALRIRVSAATLALHQTLDEVMIAFDQHVRELNQLRETLLRTEQALQPAPPPEAVSLPPLPQVPQIPQTMARPPMPPAQQAVAPQPQMPAVPSMPIQPVGAFDPSALSSLIAATQPAPPMTQVIWPSSVNAAPQTAPEAPISPTHLQSAPPSPPKELSLEEATLEELNAALAYAFAQVSNPRVPSQEMVSKMMPPPLPTSAMRFGRPLEAAGKP